MIGVTINEVGRATKNPKMKAFLHLAKKSGANPMFTNVRKNDIKKDIASPINIPNSNVEYFL